MIVHRFNSIAHPDLTEHECTLDLLYITSKNSALKKIILPHIKIKEKLYPSKIKGSMYLKVLLKTMRGGY